MIEPKYKLRITITFTSGALQTVDCDKMLRATSFKQIEVMGLFREEDKPSNPHCKWLPFFMINMANVASIHRMTL